MTAREEPQTQSLELAREELAAVLDEHQRRQRLIEGKWVLVCRCGRWRTDIEFDDRSEEQHDLHRAHLADALLASPALANLHDPFPQANPYVTTDKGPKEELIATQRQEFGSSWDELVPTEGRTLGWIIESVITDVLDNCHLDPHTGDVRPALTLPGGSHVQHRRSHRLGPRRTDRVHA